MVTPVGRSTYAWNVRPTAAPPWFQIWKLCNVPADSLAPARTPNTLEEASEAFARATREFPKDTIKKYQGIAQELGIHIDHIDLRDLHIHDLRRTLGSWLVSGGTSLPIVGKILNHKSPQATQVYARLMLEPVRTAMEEASAAFKAAAKS